VVSSAWSELLPERQGDARLLATSIEIPSDCIAHRPHLDASVVARATNAFVELLQNSGGAALLKDTFRAERFVAGDKAPYAAIQSWL